jgi:hypothetical protein
VRWVDEALAHGGARAALRLHAGAEQALPAGHVVQAVRRFTYSSVDNHFD